MRQVTFDIPDEVLEAFNRAVPASEQSAEVAKIMQRASRLKMTEKQWAAVCEAANKDPETQEIEGVNVGA